VNGSELTWLVPKRDEGQRWEILHALALAKTGETNLATLLERINPSLGRNQSLIVVTSSVNLDWMNSDLSLKARGIIPTVMMLDPATFGGRQSAQSSASIIRQRGLTCHVIPRGFVQPPQQHPEKKREWSWRQTSNGQIVPVQSAQRVSRRSAAK
jgi:hypothetical protein